MDNVHEGFRLESEFAATEDEVLKKEAELRVYAKKEVEGLLSTKVIQIRKDVERGRTELRNLHNKLQDLEHQKQCLEADLRNNEHVERRRIEVSLETESSLSQVK